ncbi:transmembrane protein [Herbaspirillum sp. GW103]|uniref:RDD family protein n=1 Tax=unclassified Herbaspirillum TaxID=2624150 RepID=UPI00025E2697|nr:MULTISPECIES: RDD family protein [unclassified Herbaspirillum]EIJ46923.1 transmembrane protein [Herbaspirillum sp. GW103]MCI1003991.1 RDD family protein [Herbaspirillum sp. C7C8]
MPELTTPSLRRRMSSMLYESMLLFGVLFMSGWLFSTLLQQRHALYLRHALEGWLFLVLAAYFIWFWTHGGQTLAMKTWRFRVVDRDGLPLRPWRALLRFLLAWLWILPGLALASLTRSQAWLLFLIPAANLLLWAMTARMDPHGQFLHDRLAGTRLVDLTPRPRAADSPPDAKS